MTFSETKNTLNSDKFIKKFCVESNDYSITFIYNGNYAEDRKNRALKMQNVLMSVTPKNGNIPLSLNNYDKQHPVICCVSDCSDICSEEKDFEHVKCKLDLAKKAVEKLNEIVIRTFIQS